MTIENIQARPIPTASPASSGLRMGTGSAGIAAYQGDRLHLRVPESVQKGVGAAAVGLIAGVGILEAPIAVVMPFTTLDPGVIFHGLILTPIGAASGLVAGLAARKYETWRGSIVAGAIAGGVTAGATSFQYLKHAQYHLKGSTVKLVGSAVLGGVVIGGIVGAIEHQMYDKHRLN